MIYIKYILMALISLPLTLMGFILSPVLPLLSSEKEGKLDNGGSYGLGPRLPDWLSWFQTPDNSLDGDAGFEKLNGKGYWPKIKWLCRNPTYAFGLKYLNSPYESSVSGDKTIKDNDNARAGWCLVKSNGLFQFTWVKSIGFSRCIYCNFGWNIRALVDDNVNPKPDPYEATFVFSPRISGFR
jgi:hypothetical protein